MNKIACEQIHLTTEGHTITVNVKEDATPIHDIVETTKNNQMAERDDNSFLITDVGHIIKKYDEWTRAVPNVTPFYALKCNKDPVIVRLLAELGAGFDCASKQEMEDVLHLGVSVDRIIFANPCKMISHLEFAAKCGVKMMTFDRDSELHKIQQYFKDARIILRFKPHNPNDTKGIALKFGCPVEDAPRLLNLAKQLGLNVIGVAFHAGNYANPEIIARSIKQSLTIFNEALTIGFKLSLLDIGGGYPGYVGSEATFNPMAAVIREGLSEVISAFPNTKIVSEPGKFFTTAASTVALMIHSKMTQSNGTREYHVSDGIYGTFAVCPHNPSFPQPNILKWNTVAETYPSVIWGPTAGPDKTMTASLPTLEIGDWLYFKDMGSYTREFGSWAFCGFPRPKCHYFVSQEYKERLLQLLQQS